MENTETLKEELGKLYDLLSESCGIYVYQGHPKFVKYKRKFFDIHNKAVYKISSNTLFLYNINIMPKNEFIEYLDVGNLFTEQTIKNILHNCFVARVIKTDKSVELFGLERERKSFLNNTYVIRNVACKTCKKDLKTRIILTLRNKFFLKMFVLDDIELKPSFKIKSPVKKTYNFDDVQILRCVNDKEDKRLKRNELYGYNNILERQQSSKRYISSLFDDVIFNRNDVISVKRLSDNNIIETYARYFKPYKGSIPSSFT